MYGDKLYFVLEIINFTHDCFFAKEDVDNSNVFLPGVVENLLGEKVSSCAQHFQSSESRLGL